MLPAHPPDQVPQDPARFMAALEPLRRDPDSFLAAGSAALEPLLEAWGNRRWAAWSDYLQIAMREALTAPGPILECGSGLSTLLLGCCAQAAHVGLWSLEEQPAWAARIAHLAQQLQLPAITLCPAPLRDYPEGFRWYAPPWERLPQAPFQLIACDGPAARHDPHSRYGLLPVMRPHLAPGAIILLDDGERDGEQAIAARWAATLGCRIERHASPHSEKICLHLRVPQ